MPVSHATSSFVEKPGFVSLWVGTARSAEDLETYLTFNYTEDGDALPCGLCRDFGFDWFDEDFREAAVRDDYSSRLSTLLAGFSDHERITRVFATQHGDRLPQPSNAVVLIYEHEYTPGPISGGNDRVALRFAGAVRYK